MNEAPELVTVAEAAKRLGVPREAVAEAIREGRAKAIRVRFGHRVLELVCAGQIEKGGLACAPNGETKEKVSSDLPPLTDSSTYGKYWADLEKKEEAG